MTTAACFASAAPLAPRAARARPRMAPSACTRPAAGAAATARWRGSSSADVAAAGAALRRGALVAFPTETVYGLGACARDADAVARVFSAKGRPGDNPLIVHAGSARALRGVVAHGALGGVAGRLAARFWPGPLTLVVRAADGGVCAGVTAGLDTVAVRVPGHAVARAVLDAAGVPVAAPSANVSGRPSPTCAAHVLRDLDGRIAGVVDGGAGGCGLESTVVDVTGEVGVVLRPGAVSLAALENAAGARFDVAGGGAGGVVRSPGMKYRHYAPRARVVLVRDGGAAEDAVRAAGGRVGLLADAETCAEVCARVDAVPVVCGRRGCVESVARGLYAALRRFDGEAGVDGAAGVDGVDVIVAVGVEEADGDISAAVMNRLRKAAAG